MICARLYRSLKDKYIYNIMNNKNTPNRVAKGKDRTLIAASQRTFSGPLPSPDDFDAYGRTLPDAPERILKMAENQSSHRINIENKMLKMASRESILGQIIGFLIAIIFLGAAIWLAIEGHDALAGTIIVALSSLIAIFVIKKSPQKEKE